MLNVLAVGIHPYFLSMTYAVTLALLLEYAVQKRQWLRPAVYLGSNMVCTATLGWALGLLYGTATSGGQALYGYFAMNLNALWNPVGVNGVLYSRLLPAQNQVGGNYDAFAYLGLGVLAALLLKSTVFKGEAVPFVMELPNYRLPGLKNVAQLLWEKARDFLERAFTVIFLATIIIWFLQSFDLRLSLTTDPQQSILAWLASGIAPLFAPLGFADWRVSTALITGFMAKESVVSTLTILYGSSAAFAAALSPAAAAPLLVFCLLYTPCIAAVASVKRELGGKWAFIMVANQCIVAWLAAFGTRLIMML